MCDTGSVFNVTGTILNARGHLCLRNRRRAGFFERLDTFDFARFPKTVSTAGVKVASEVTRSPREV